MSMFGTNSSVRALLESVYYAGASAEKPTEEVITEHHKEVMALIRKEAACLAHQLKTPPPIGVPTGPEMLLTSELSLNEE